MELRAGFRHCRVSQPEGIGGRSGKAFDLADARIGAFEDGSRLEFFAKDAHTCLAYAWSEQPFGKELNNDQIAVLVDNEAGQFVGLAEA